MVIDIKKREIFEGHQDLFDFARAYLSEAFPNPDRAGCPKDHVLSSLARNPRKGDPSIADHVTCCSPCFNAYLVHLEQARAEAEQSCQTFRTAGIRWSLLSASVAIVLLLLFYALLIKPQNEPNTTQRLPAPISQPASPAQTPVLASVRVLLDLTTGTPERGHQSRSHTLIQRIPAEPRLDLTLRLPIGSEAVIYSVSLSSGQRTEWSRAARARIEEGEPVLNMLVDFSHIPGGNYELVVASKGQRLRLPVVIARPLDRQR
jgi:hypothetical protein